MTTLDHIPSRPAPRMKSRDVAMTLSALLLLALGGVAVSAPPADVSADWHGNVAASAPR
ncbi:hypothetical protein [Roseovarius atlanticus]|uniref:hypothetical protein n=1 Tax=Roseovarius atlanticus TaxID=1641875 RepID=UPI001C955259|nr:hypothetical protein [Roseovarius atlanticus]MBY5988956.1 hypothetical protein [Roseovarius atlanticus]MBY6124348.1 hypothetical protein [Roseovarius atlanticus]MBY6148843.1 hypothetical protein [Roseovarius atlanticus]